MFTISVKKQMYMPLLFLFVLVAAYGLWAFHESRAVQARTLAMTESRDRLLRSSTAVPGCMDQLVRLLSRVTRMTEIIGRSEIAGQFDTARTCVESNIAVLEQSGFASEFMPKVRILRREIKSWFDLSAIILGLHEAAAVPTVWTVSEHKTRVYKAAEQLVFDVSEVVSEAENRMHDQSIMDLRWAFAAVFAALVLILVTTVLLTKRIVDPLIRIKNNAQAIASGSKGMPFTDDERGDEIGALSKAIGAMHETLETQVEQITSLAFVDNLTKLRNRAGCLQDMSNRIDSTNPDEKFALVHLDLDKFKRINDTLGHAAGDALLSEVGRRLTNLLDDTAAGTAYRWGGDEFLLLVDKVDEELVDLCSELVDILSIPIQYEDTIVRPTASLGVARYPQDGDSFDSLMIYSDIALYKAKENGRDGFHFFTKELKEQIDVEAKIDRELRVALKEHQLFLVYQPQLDVTTRRVTGIECLVRWQHPDRGVISPAVFLGAAESSKLAPLLGRYVLDEALRAARDWTDRDLKFGRISVNLSPQHVAMGTVFEDFTTTMSRYGVKPEFVAAEVLETAFLENEDGQGIEGIENLRNIGVHIHLDNFGTGYGSLSRLSSLPIDGLKIDKSFIARMQTDNKKMVVVQSLISLAKLMNFSLTCEGVESEDQYSVLREFGSCSVQGYYFARPMSLDDVTDWLETNAVDLRRETGQSDDHGDDAVVKLAPSAHRA